jgi:holo-[acyl-carrier protein] synthase
MSVRSFPIPVNIGTDICRISRIASLISASKEPNATVDKKRLGTFVNRIFCPEEADFFFNRKQTSQLSIAQSLAGRWAAKEAIIKAARRKLYMKEIFTYQKVDGSMSAFILDTGFRFPPKQSIGDPRDGRTGLISTYVALRSENKFNAYRWLLQTLKGVEARVTISHDGDYAIAVAMVPDGLWTEPNSIARAYKAR